MKTSRLDQILIRRGYVDEAQVKKALMRQKSRGGRLGSHLLYLGFVTEEQLAEALSEQHKVATFDAEEHVVASEALEVIAAETAEDLQILPVDFDSEMGLLTIVIADPGDTRAVAVVRRAFGATRVERLVAPESVLADLIKKHYHGGDKSIEAKQIIELPELFDADVGSGNEEATAAPRDENAKNILMVTKAVALRNFLAPIFEREGFRLYVLSDPAEVATALKESSFDHVMVSEETAAVFSGWIKSGKIPPVHGEVTVFSNVSRTLLDNPVPYSRVVRSIFRSAEVIAEERCPANAWVPAFVPICRDIRALAGRLGFRRVAIDGIQLAAHLLLPTSNAIGWTRGKGNGSPPPFAAFSESIDIAKTLHFPWNVADALHAVHELYSGGYPSEPDDETKREQYVGAQALALVWYRHIVLRGIDGPEDRVMTTIKTRLRDQTGHLAGLDIVEVYIRILEDASGDLENGTFTQVLVVGQTDDIARQFSTRFTRAQCNTVWTDDIEDARRMCERQSPTAVLVHYESYPDEIMEAAREFKKNPGVLLYALTYDNNPTVTLDLLDAGFDDVMLPPHDYDIIAARISRSVRGISQRSGSHEKPGSFRATFEALSFLDLIQTLGQSLRSVKIVLRRGNDAEAVVYMDKGRLVHAVCAGQEGTDAVYEVITWENDGSFVVEPVSEFPSANIHEANESILMEGCRLLDESRA